MNFYTSVFYDGFKILYRGISNGESHDAIIPFETSIYIGTDKGTKYKTINGKYAEKICFSSIYELNDFKKTYENVSGFHIHGDIGTEYQYIASEYGNDIEYDYSMLKTMYIDIETTCEDGFPEINDPQEKVIAITAMVNDIKTVFCLGRYESTNESEVVKEYDDEAQMLYDFVLYFREENPHIISGWNIRLFDMPYLINRINVLENDLLSADKLSPFEIIKKKTIEKGGNEYLVYDIVGVATLDYYELYKTFTYVNQESYKLDHIAWVELGERKISYEEYESISDFYKKNFQKFIEYNIKDVELVQRLEQKMRLMELAVALAYSAGVNFQDVFSQVRTWDVIIYNHLLKRNIIIPPKKHGSKNDQYAGAYVKDPLVGMHNWVVSFDISSMYPSTIMQYNISPETLIDHYDLRLKVNDIVNPDNKMKSMFGMLKDENTTITANGTCYTKEKHGFLPELMDKMYKDRKAFKDKMIECKKNLESINEEMKRRGL